MVAGWGWGKVSWRWANRNRIRSLSLSHEVIYQFFLYLINIQRCLRRICWKTSTGNLIADSRILSHICPFFSNSATTQARNQRSQEKYREANTAAGTKQGIGFVLYKKNYSEDKEYGERVFHFLCCLHRIAGSGKVGKNQTPYFHKFKKKTKKNLIVN